MQLGNSKAMRRAMAWSPGGLLLGVALGVWAHAGNAPLKAFGDLLDPLGNLWMKGLQLAVIPMVASLLVAGIGSMREQAGLGRWTGLSLGVFLGLLVTGAVLAAGLSAAYLPMMGPSAQPAPGLSSTVSLPEAKALTFADGISGLLPANLLASAAAGEMLPITLCAILFALAVRKLPEPGRTRIVELFQAVRDAIFIYLTWVLALMPFAAFALAFAFAAEVGFAAAGVALHFLVFIVALLLAMTALLYLLVPLFGRVSVARFARAAYPAQVVALGTRSSLASLPSVVQSARDLGLPEPASEIVLPLAASVFKLNRTVSSTGKLLFTAAAFGVALSPGDVFAFVITVIVLSVSTPGLPSLGTRITFGAYVAAGLPPATIVLFDALDPIIDLFKTALNVTGNLASACIVSRFAQRQPESAAPTSEPMPEPA